MKIILVIVGATAVAWWFLSQPKQRAYDELRAFLNEQPKIIDVRTPEEFMTDHVKGAINIPVNEVSARLGELGGQQQPIGVYCRSGQRSERAKKALEQAGYKQVVNLGGLQFVQELLKSH